MSKKILSRAPVRICDIGGWTDTWFYKNGAVFNFSIDLYSYVLLIENKSKKVRIISNNLGIQTIISDYDSIVYNGTLDLIKAGIKRLEIRNGVDIHIKTEAPPGSGMGTSASVAVALLGALAKYADLNFSPKEIAKLAHELEVKELQLESGVQDQYTAAYGGINYLEIDYPSVKAEQIQIDEGRLLELEKQLIILYVGPRNSNAMHKLVIENYTKGDPITLNSLDIMKKCAKKMKYAINSNIKDIGEIMNQNWSAQKSLNPLMTNSLIEKAENIAFKQKALGFKCNGAGGGGSITILSSIKNEYDLRKKFLENNFNLLPCKLCFQGVKSVEI
jgi:D-glycero-alpha-D-manno-heptose-7-phosphate kinase